MNILRAVGFIYIASYFLNVNHFSLAAPLTESLLDRQKIDTFNTTLAQVKPESNLLAQYQAPTAPTAPIFTIRSLGGSADRGKVINNQENSLSCTLQKWQLIGFFKDNHIYKTKGELVFEITNNSKKSKQFVLAELLFLDDRDRILTVSNPHRDLQGEFIKLEPPIKPGETREYTSDIQYKSGWHKVQLKTCRWLKHGSEYWQDYLESKPAKKES